MNLFRVTGEFSLWFSQVLGCFWKSKPGVTLVVVASAIVARVCNILAFMLPIKILLLAGSSGVPRYFRFFIEPAHKMEWIVGLAAAALIFYLLSLVLESVSDRLAEVGGADVMSRANDISVVVEQQEKVKNYYALSCHLWANFLFVILALVALSWLNLWALFTVLGLVAIEYLYSAWALRADRESSLTRSGLYIRDNLGRYLKMLSSVNFFISFSVVLLPFFLDVDANILMAIASVKILRQVFRTLRAIFVSAVNLSKQKDRISPLVFRHVQVERKNQRHSVTLMQLFDKSYRSEWLARRLSYIIPEGEGITVNWRDPSIKSMNALSVDAGSRFNNGSEALQLQIFGDKWSHYQENESFLFAKASRQNLLAPDLVTSFTEAGFPCQVLDTTGGIQVSESQWVDLERRILQRHWHYAPPDSLVSAYTASHPLLHQRLTGSLLERLKVAAESQEEIKRLQAFVRRLCDLMEFVGKFPLYIYNPNIAPENVLELPDSVGALVTTWGEWGLEPIGIRLPAGLKKYGLQQLVNELKEERLDVPLWFNVDCLRLASQLWRLESLIGAQRYKAALATITNILENPAVCEKHYLAEIA